jgi:hypothetical protein
LTSALSIHVCSQQDVQYAFKATNSNTETEEEKEKSLVGNYEEIIKALTAQLQEATANSAKWSGPNSQQDMNKKYAWKRIPP